jgi:hypothetical protein
MIGSMMGFRPEVSDDLSLVVISQGIPMPPTDDGDISIHRRGFRPE